MSCMGITKNVVPRGAPYTFAIIIQHPSPVPRIAFERAGGHALHASIANLLPHENNVENNFLPLFNRFLF